jgi:hypothetical protein
VLAGARSIWRLTLNGPGRVAEVGSDARELPEPVRRPSEDMRGHLATTAPGTMYEMA